MGESKSERFIRLAESRTNKAIDAIRMIGNLSKPSLYEYTDEDTFKIISALRKAVDETELKLRNHSDYKKQPFRLNSCNESEITKEANSESARCKRCGDRLQVSVGDMLIAKSHYNGTNICDTCMVEHCVATDCNICTIGKPPSCQFLGTKEFYLREITTEKKDIQI